MEPKNHYAKKSDLIEQITKSKATQKKFPKRKPSECLTPELIKMIEKIVYKFGELSNWRSYSYIEDMKASAFMAVCHNALKFDPEKGDNAFNYYTMIANRTFLTYIDSEKRQRDIRDDLIEMSSFSGVHKKTGIESAEGIRPSFARQSMHEQTQLGPSLDGTRRIPVKRGRFRRRKATVLDGIPQHTIDSEPPPIVEE